VLHRREQSVRRTPSARAFVNRACGWRSWPCSFNPLPEDLPVRHRARCIANFLSQSGLWRTPPGSKCLGRPRKKPITFSILQEIHQIGAVIRSREYRPGETAFGPPTAEVGAQPLPHNPRKQRKNPAAAGWGERLRGGEWRIGWVWDPTFSISFATMDAALIASNLLEVSRHRPSLEPNNLVGASGRFVPSISDGLDHDHLHSSGGVSWSLEELVEQAEEGILLFVCRYPIVPQKYGQPYFAEIMGDVAHHY